MTDDYRVPLTIMNSLIVFLIVYPIVMISISMWIRHRKEKNRAFRRSR